MSENFRVVVRRLGVGATLAIAGLLALIAVFGDRFPGVPARTTVLLAAAALLTLAAWAIAASSKVRQQRVPMALMLLAGWIGLRIIAPALANAPLGTLTPDEADATAALRWTAVAAADARLRLGHFPSSLDSLRNPARTSVRVARSLTDAGEVLSLRARSGTADCELDITAPRAAAMTSGPSNTPDDERTADHVVGAPTCNRSLRRYATQAIPTLSTRPAGAVIKFAPEDLGGSWPQQRSTPERSGEVMTQSPRVHAMKPWRAYVQGSVRSSVAIAGGQILVGTYGTGDIAAFALADGQLGWQTRAPNWIHHEPVADSATLYVGFGNNEYVWRPVLGQAVWLARLLMREPVRFGSPSSGVAAYDRRTGAFRWADTVGGTLMGSPALADSLVLALTGDSRLVAWRARDGAPAWSLTVPGLAAPMTSPLVTDSLVVVTTEPATACAVNWRTVKIRWCWHSPARDLGMGHTTPARAGSLILATSVEPDEPTVGWVWLNRLTHLVLGVDAERLVPTPHPARRVVHVWALDLATGAVRWHRAFDGPWREVRGHLAGTPVVVGASAWITLPAIGEVVSLDTGTGQVRWRSSVHPARGSISVLGDGIFVATDKPTWVMLDAASGRERCRGVLPARSDRAGLSVAGGFGVLPLLDGTILGSPVGDWAACAPLP